MSIVIFTVESKIQTGDASLSGWDVCNAQDNRIDALPDDGPIISMDTQKVVQPTDDVCLIPEDLSLDFEDFLNTSSFDFQ